MKLLMFTSRKYERFVDRCVEGLTTQSKLKIAVVTDTGNINFSRKYVGSRHSWVKMAVEGVSLALDDGFMSECDRVIVAMEDHLPMKPLDLAAIQKIPSELAGNEILYFNLCAGKGSRKLSDREGVVLRQMRPTHYSSLTPAIWKVGHFLAQLRRAASASIDTPWEFERLNCDELHCTSNHDYWTCVTDGFMAGGRVNKAALVAMIRNRRMPATSLFFELLLAYALERSARAFGYDLKVYQ